MITLRADDTASGFGSVTNAAHPRIAVRRTACLSTPMARIEGNRFRISAHPAEAGVQGRLLELCGNAALDPRFRGDERLWDARVTMHFIRQRTVAFPSPHFRNGGLGRRARPGRRGLAERNDDLDDDPLLELSRQFFRWA